MGFYDTRCMVTGVSLKGADSALVLLQEGEAGFSPLSLAIKGTYNRLGSIDMIDEDENTRLVFEFFVRERQSGSFVTDDDYFRSYKHDPFDSVESLLHAFERNMNDGTVATLGGVPVVFSLVSRAVWEVVAGNAPPPAAVGVDQAFGNSPIPEQIYPADVSAIGEQLVEFVTVRGWLAAHEIAWSPPSEWNQDYPDEMREYLAEARLRFPSSELIQAALDEYEHEVGDLLRDEG